MAVIAVHRESGSKYIVLGGGVRMFTPSHPLKAGANRSLEVPKPVPVTMMAVCNAEGTIEWFRSEELVVVEVDGATPAGVLAPRTPYR